MLSRWIAHPKSRGITSDFKSSHVVVVPSPHFHWVPGTRAGVNVSFEDMLVNDRSYHELYWTTLRDRFPAHEQGGKLPLLVVNIGFVFDRPFTTAMMMVLLNSFTPDFQRRVVFATFESNLQRVVRQHLPPCWSPHVEQLFERPSCKAPSLITVPYPVSVHEPASFFTEPAEGVPNATDRPVRVLLHASRKGGNRSAIRQAVRQQVQEAGAACSKQVCMLCAEGDCPEQFVSNATTLFEKPGHFVWDLALSSTFCLEPAGDTLTRSHFYVAVLSGCIPVIFDGGHSAFESHKTAWAFRKSRWLSDGLDYHSFAVVLKADQVLSGDLDVVQYLSELPEKQPHRVLSLRRGLDRVAPLMRYSMHLCQEKDCDAFERLVRIVLKRL